MCVFCVVSVRSLAVRPPPRLLRVQTYFTHATSQENQHELEGRQHLNGTQNLLVPWHRRRASVIKRRWRLSSSRRPPVLERADCLKATHTAQLQLQSRA